MAVTSQEDRAKTARPDYGWLAELMATWVQNLEKRYPASLRAEGIQGKVTLMALLHEDGRLSHVKVAKSSGNLELDQVAVEDVTKGVPLVLSRPLERPQISIKLSIIYDLESRGNR
jgi:TonB family protein